jgi:formate dehydrogenase major subunit
VIQGSNMAECHPVAFRWVAQAKLRGAKLVHVDPRFTRTSAMADLHVPIRAGSDLAFLGGLVRWVIENDRWFREYVVRYTNAATIVSDEFEDTEDLDGVFSGLRPSRADPGDGARQEYDSTSWAYARPGRTDETLQDPRCVFQVVRRHFARYTPETVERATGCPRDVFEKVAETIASSSGRDRTTAFCYAVAWTQHTYGPQIIGCCALLQLLLGNIGRPGGGILALRGHASIQGSTDVPTLYHSVHGYMKSPDARKKHETLQDYLRIETGPTGRWADELPKDKVPPPTGYWANKPKFFVSYLKSMWGAAATKENDFGYGWHPRISADHSHMPTVVRMAEGKVRGMICVGQNPAVGGQNARLQREALGRLRWLVVKDNFLTETATFWSAAPEVLRGERKPADVATEVFFFPSAQVGETEGSFTNTQRLVQWHEKAADPEGVARSDPWFTYQLGKRLKALYASSDLPRDQGFKHLVWDYEPDAPPSIPGEPDVRKVLREINGFDTASGDHLSGFDKLKDDGSTTCASWIYCGIYPEPGKIRAASRVPDPEGGTGANLDWGYAWPANRRILYNRASAAPDGTPWSERKKWVWWDGSRWTGRDVPDFPATKAPTTPAKDGGRGLDAHAGTDPFLMQTDGKGWLFVPEGLVDGPLPTHYEPAESPVENPLYRQQASPVLRWWDRPDNALAEVGDPRFPFVLTTYRLTEHHLSGVMSRWLPWLAELQPELFVEISPELAALRGVRNLDRVRVRSRRGSIAAKALVTRRLRPLTISGKTVHHVGLPWHWGYAGLVRGDVVNDLSALVGDPNVTIHEAKSFLCDVVRDAEGGA